MSFTKSIVEMFERLYVWVLKKFKKFPLDKCSGFEACSYDMYLFGKKCIKYGLGELFGIQDHQYIQVQLCIFNP